MEVGRKRFYVAEIGLMSREHLQQAASRSIVAMVKLQDEPVVLISNTVYIICFNCVSSALEYNM